MSTSGESVLASEFAATEPRRVSLQVNGEAVSIDVEPRTLLADLLRDHLHLTGTHLGCEQGVCGACTVIIDGKPMRSCIAYASRCDGSSVDTIEGLAHDPLMNELRTEFSQQHALQCGFCTPGMLIMARDMVQRISPLDEERIRLELGGNLCRCTGYMGIVEAIRRVSERHSVKIVKTTERRDDPVSTKQPRSFVAFSIAEEFLCAETSAASTEAVPDGEELEDWTIVVRSFELAHTKEAAWRLFEDLYSVSDCVPGLSMTEVRGEEFSCNMQIKFGPICANFAGNGKREHGPGEFESRLEGEGGDKSGQAAVRAVVAYRVDDSDVTNQATIRMMLRYQIEGPLAQFNRKDLAENFIEILLRNFVSNANALLSGEELRGTDSLSTFGLLKDVILLQWSKLSKRVCLWFSTNRDGG